MGGWKSSHGLSKLSQVSTEFLQWFTGFTDAEGNFLISFDRNFVRFRFKISLHIDDIDTLHTIQSMLGIGIVTEENKQYCSFVVQDYDQIKYILCPIFLHFPLQTNKRLDFDSFYEAILIKEEKGNNLTDIKDKLLVIKNSMNRNREIMDSTGHFESFAINFCWLVGRPVFVFSFFKWKNKNL